MPTAALLLRILLLAAPFALPPTVGAQSSRVWDDSEPRPPLTFPDPGPCPENGSIEGPALWIEELGFDWGTVHRGDRIERTIRVRNPGTETLEILNYGTA